MLEISATSIICTIINLIVLCLLLRHFLIKPVTDIMEKRKTMIEEGFANARSAQEDADRLKAEYEASLSGAKEESVQIVERARTQAKGEYDRIISEADERAGGILAAAKENVRMEQEQARRELESQIALLAMASAEKIMCDRTANSSLYDQFLSEEGMTNEE